MANKVRSVQLGNVLEGVGGDGYVAVWDYVEMPVGGLESVPCYEFRVMSEGACIFMGRCYSFLRGKAAVVSFVKECKDIKRRVSKPLQLVLNL